MTSRRVILIAGAIWLLFETAVLVYAQGPRITPAFVANWLSAQGFVQGADVQLCPQQSCATYHIDSLTIENQGDYIVVKFLPRRR